MNDEKSFERRINVGVIEHKVTHLLVAMSEDLPGLMVAARSEAQIERELPDAIKEVLEAEGHVVLSVTAEPTTTIPESFVRHSIVANARMATLHG